MIIANPTLLKSFRGPGICEYCKRPCQSREAHHLHTVGAGRLDIKINLMALGTAWQCPCHREFHDGHILQCDMLAVVATREETFQDHIVEVVHLLRRLPKWPRPWQIEDELKQLGASRALAMRVLRECDLVFEE